MAGLSSACRVAGRAASSARPRHVDAVEAHTGRRPGVRPQQEDRGRRRRVRCAAAAIVGGSRPRRSKGSASSANKISLGKYENSQTNRYDRRINTRESALTKNIDFRHSKVQRSLCDDPLRRQQ
jgi:hypothetical protein